VVGVGHGRLKSSWSHVGDTSFSYDSKAATRLYRQTSCSSFLVQVISTLARARIGGK